MTLPSSSFVIALVGAVGSPLGETARELESKIKTFGYRVHILKLSDAFAHADQSLTQDVDGRILPQDPHAKVEGRYREIRRAMALGNAARESYGTIDGEKGGCLGQLSVHAISGLRPSMPKSCFIIHSLKSPAELEVLRRVYGRRLLAVGLHTPKDERFARLLEQIQYTTGRSPTAAECVTRLIGIDESERGHKFGQNVEGVFGRCDVFLSATGSDGRLRQQVDRIVRLMFLDPFETPTADESAMAQAFAASLRSASLARNVGAAITTRQGDLIATGFNEVHQYGGSPYTSGAAVDGRDFARGHDENVVQKRVLLQQLVQIAHDEGLLKDGQSIGSAVDKIEAAPEAKDMLARNITEFVREVHAEMAALCSAVKRGVPVAGALLYTTTFPCHNCAKHILACGVSEVVFIEAYAKSFAETFYRDSLALDRPSPDKLLVRAFNGVGPRAYPALFAWRERRNDADGRVLVSDPASNKPWFALEDWTTDQELAHREEEAIKQSRERLGKVFRLEEAIRVLQKASPGLKRASGPPPSVSEELPMSRKRAE